MIYLAYALAGILLVLTAFAVVATMFSSMLSRKEERRLSVPPKNK